MSPNLYYVFRLDLGYYESVTSSDFKLYIREILVQIIPDHGNRKLYDDVLREMEFSEIRYKGMPDRDIDIEHFVFPNSVLKKTQMNSPHIHQGSLPYIACILIMI
jgi:hypothetical protein